MMFGVHVSELHLGLQDDCILRELAANFGMWVQLIWIYHLGNFRSVIPGQQMATASRQVTQCNECPKKQTPGAQGAWVDPPPGMVKIPFFRIFFIAPKW